MKIIRLIFFGVTCSFLAAASVFAATPKESMRSHPLAFSIPEELKNWNKKQSLSLQEHQLTPIAYLEKNKDIKGLIINHYLGTGKTFLSIGFAERNPGSSIIILGPSFLEGHWIRELEKYGVKDKSRYRFVSYNKAEALIKEDLSNSVLIIDESHRLIEKVRLQTQNNNYAKLYLNLKKAYRILSLTGTPIYNDVFDLVYQINLVSGKNEFTFNHENFRLELSSMNKIKSYWRGQLLESNYILPIASFSATWMLGLTVSPYFFPVMPFAPFLGLVAHIFLPVENSPIRHFDAKKLAEVIQKYISYYNFDHNTNLYPRQVPQSSKLAYNDAQLQLLFRFYDSGLKDRELMQLLKDDNLATSDRENIILNSSATQDMRKVRIGAGREIGNLIFSKVPAEGAKKTKNKAKTLDDFKEKRVIFPAKFKRILQKIKSSQGPVVVYSHYYYNGLLLFKQFLDAYGYQDKYRIFHPDMSLEEQIQVVEEYNTNKVKILLLHPDITEGISLKGTRQLHFLEVPVNSSLKQQIIGRAVRYKSHVHLPEAEQKVQVYIWYYIFSMLDLKAQAALRENWHHSFGELSYYSIFGMGRSQVDKNAALKKNSPDKNAYIHLGQLNKQMEDFRGYVKMFCIENLKA